MAVLRMTAVCAKEGSRQKPTCVVLPRIRCAGNCNSCKSGCWSMEGTRGHAAVAPVWRLAASGCTPARNGAAVSSHPRPSVSPWLNLPMAAKSRSPAASPVTSSCTRLHRSRH